MEEKLKKQSEEMDTRHKQQQKEEEDRRRAFREEQEVNKAEWKKRMETWRSELNKVEEIKKKWSDQNLEQMKECLQDLLVPFLKDKLKPSKKKKKSLKY